MAGVSADIKGYRELSDEQIEWINRIKDAELELGGLYRFVKGMKGVDKRFAAIAKTHFQEGFSALVRSIAQPHDAFDFDN
jgi:hypothetical protein